MFDRNGNFLFQVGRSGNGPKEYGRINHVEYDPVQKTIYISSAQRTGILTFGSQGTYLGSILPKHRLSDWHKKNDHFIINVQNYHGNSRDMLIILAEQGDTLAKIPNYDFFTQEGNPLNLNDMAIIYHFDDNIYYNRMFNDTIYNVNDDNQLTPEYIFSSSSHKVDQSTRSNGAKFATTQTDYILPWNILETERYLFVEMFRNQRGLNPYLYDKTNRNFISLHNENDIVKGFVNDLNDALPFFPQYVLDKDRLCAVLESYKIAQYKEAYPLNVSDLSEVAENDNPVLAIITLKKGSE